MTSAGHIAVIDVGKTNAKLALVDAETLCEVAVETRPNEVISGPPYPHFDLEGHWQFFVENLRAFQNTHEIKAISITTHGASIVLLDKDGDLATPMLDYEHDEPDGLAEAYDALRPPFSETGSPRLPGGLNVGAQLHWLFDRDPTLKQRTATIMTYPQFWGFRLTGQVGCDVTSLGCHTDLWNPWTGEPSSLATRLGVADKLAPARKPSDVFGTIHSHVATLTGLNKNTPVQCGIHDSNASLVPYLSDTTQAISVVSTGTWVICMAINGDEVPLDPTRDTLVNVNALGAPVPSARFMGGREYEMIRDGSNVEPTEADRSSVLERGTLLLPSVAHGSGPFADHHSKWINPPRNDGERIYTLSLYLALMTDTCLRLAGGTGTTIVEGPFARNTDYIAMLAALRNAPIDIAASATGTSVGAAMLAQELRHVTTEATPVPARLEDLQHYAKIWRARVCD